MAEKQKKIVVDNAMCGRREVILPEGAIVQFVGEYVIAYPSSWRVETPIFHMRIPQSNDPVIVNVTEVSADDALLEKIKNMSESEIGILRNIMESAGLLN